MRVTRPRPPAGVLVTMTDKCKGFPQAFEWTIPLKTINPLNKREHWRQRATRVAAERMAVALTLPLWLRGALGRGKWPKAIVTMVRISPGTLDDDAVPGSLKGVRDEIAKQLGVDDRDCRVGFVTQQEKGKEYAVRIQIEKVTL